MSKFEVYLENVARQLRHLPTDVRNAEVREMRSHLELLRDDFAAQGQNPETAARAALEQFGDARTVGIKVRDVWEGQDFSWKRVVLAFFFGLVPFLMHWSLSKGLALFQSWPESAFFTTSWSLPIPFTSGSQSIDFFSVLLLILPALTSIIHAFFLGRRAWMMSAAIYGYGLCWSATTLFGRPLSLLNVALVTAIPAWFLFWGVLVADVSARWLRRRRRHQLVLAASDSTATFTSSRRSKTPTHFWKWLLASFFAGMAAFGGFRVSHIVQERLSLARHPQSASDAMRTKLLLSRDATKVRAPDAVAVNERAPSAAERAAGIRLIYFKVDYQLNLETQKRYLDYLKSQLGTASGRARWGEKKLRKALAEVSRNRFVFGGTAFVKKTPNGWQVDEKQRPWMSFSPDVTFDWTRLHRWLGDIPFEN